MATFGDDPYGLGLFGGENLHANRGGGFLGRFERHMNNPLVAAALGAGGAMMGSQGSFGDALRSGIMGGGAGAFGAMRMNRQRQQEDERNDLMKKLLQRYSNVADQNAGPTPPGGFLDENALVQALQNYQPAQVFDRFGAVPGIQGGGAYGQAPQFPAGSLY